MVYTNHDSKYFCLMLPVICYCLTLYTPTSAYILYTVLHTFSKELTRRICLTIKSFFVIDHFLYSCILNVWFRGETVRGYKVLVTLWGQRVNSQKLHGNVTSPSSFNPLTCKSDWHLISPYHITPESNIKVRRIKKLITH